MIRSRSLAPLALSLALLAPGLLSAKVEPVSRSFEIAPPAQSWPGVAYTFDYVEATAISLGSRGFAVGWVTAASPWGDYFTKAVWLHPDGNRADVSYNPTTLIDDGGDAGWLGLASLDKGRFVSVAEISASPDRAVVYRRFAAGQEPPDPESIPLQDTYGPPSNFAPSIASNGHGLFVITWTQSAQPYVQPTQRLAQVFDADGQPVSPVIVITKPLSDSTWGPVGMDAEGNFVALWTDPSPPLYPIWGRRFDRTGNPLGKRFRIGNLGAAAMAMAPSGEFVVAWRDASQPGKMLLGRFTADGQRKQSMASLAYKGVGPAIALDPSGRVALFWLDEELPALAVFDKSLKPLGPVAFGTPTHDSTSWAYSPVGVAFGDDSRILTVWIGKRGARSRASILGRFWQVR